MSKLSKELSYDIIRWQCIPVCDNYANGIASGKSTPPTLRFCEYPKGRGGGGYQPTPIRTHYRTHKLQIFDWRTYETTWCLQTNCRGQFFGPQKVLESTRLHYL